MPFGKSKLLTQIVSLSFWSVDERIHPQLAHHQGFSIRHQLQASQVTIHGFSFMQVDVVREKINFLQTKVFGRREITIGAQNPLMLLMQVIHQIIQKAGNLPPALPTDQFRGYFIPHTHRKQSWMMRKG